MAQPAERLEFQDYFGANYQTAYEAKPRTVVEKEPSMTVVKPRKLTFAERKQEESYCDSLCPVHSRFTQHCSNDI